MTTASEHLTLISADCHAGANHEIYRDYLEERYLEEFDRWRAGFINPFRDLNRGDRDRNWNDERRVAELEGDGVVGEVVFPNTTPPFFPTGAVIARPPRPQEYELRLAGIRAHNRWLAEWCANLPGRRAGVGQIFLNDVDDAIADVRWCHDHGLPAVLLQPVPDDMTHLKPLYASEYDPLWAVCEELGVVLNTHSGGAGMPDYGRYPAAGQVWIAETSFYSRRPLVHMLLSGAFERFPGLRFVITESGCSWIPDTLAQLDGFYQQARSTGRIGELKYDPDTLPSHSPSEYFARNCWVGASFPSPVEAASRHRVGTDRFMWGNDYPHDESTYPDTLLGLRRSFGDTDEGELRQVLGGNVAGVYGFDLPALQAEADRVGPTPADIRRPYTGTPEGNRSPAFTRA